MIPLHKRQCLFTIIFTNLPSLHPFSFHEMIFILVSPVFLASAHFVYYIVRAQYAIAHSATKNVITKPRPAGHTYVYSVYVLL